MSPGLPCHVKSGCLQTESSGISRNLRKVMRSGALAQNTAAIGKSLNNGRIDLIVGVEMVE